ncbi:SIS domain-containing protein, partial [Conexibacter stalactiti]
MLNFDEDRFRSIQGGVVALAGPLRETIGGLVDGGAKNVFFLGAGGAGVLMLPAAQLLGRLSAFPVKLVHAAEIIAMGDVSLGEGSIVVIPSLSGTTKEAIEVLEFAQGKGAKVIALTGKADTPVAEKADHNFSNFAEDDTSSEMFYLLSLVVVLSILDARGELAGPSFDAIVGELRLLPELLVSVKESFEPRAEQLAGLYRDEPYHIITGAGSAW